MQDFDELRFRARLQAALDQARLILGRELLKDPATVSHRYEDKFGLAELITSSAAAATLNVLTALGMTRDQLKTLQSWSRKNQVILRLSAVESCTFLRETIRTEDSAHKGVVEQGGRALLAVKVVTEIKEYFWKFNSTFQISVFPGTSYQDGIVFAARQGTCEVKTLLKVAPRNENVIRDPIDVNITWLFSILDDSLDSQFSIIRHKPTCKTPRRNADIQPAFRFFRDLNQWASNVEHYFFHTLFSVQEHHGLDMKVLTATKLFVPVLVFFQNDDSRDRSSADSDTKTSTFRSYYSLTDSSVLPPTSDANAFLLEQVRSISAKKQELEKLFLSESKLVTITETMIVTMMKHLQEISDSWLAGVDYIEEMLRKQLISAIGKEVGAMDFARYMSFHNRKMFKDEFQPSPFSFSVRLPQHSPEGFISIDAKFPDSSLSEPILTEVRKLSSIVPMQFRIGAATNVKFHGQRYLHAWICHKFAGQTDINLTLNARARQFSSFILLVGRIASCDTFLPKCAMIVKNKDDLEIPLLLETIPTPKQFRDAIESLSPEQQRFAKAYRQMQLESTLFGICVIQIKPQLERLLNIPRDSLTKEIKLTQELMDLFIQYQIPSDLMSYSGANDQSERFKVDTVKGHVQAIFDMIKSTKSQELHDAKQEAVFLQVEYGDVSTGEEVEDDCDRDQDQDERSAPVLDMVVAETEFTKRKAGFVFKSAARRAASQPISKIEAKSFVSKQSSSGKRDSSDRTIKAPVETKIPDEKSQTEEGFESVEHEDFLKLPQKLDQRFEELDQDNCLRPTIINIGPTWSRKSQKGLLASSETSFLSSSEQDAERERAFDLLDALSRSGTLDIEEASLHVLVAATHQFDKSVMNTLLMDNVNPIERVERSTLIMASTIQDRGVELLLKDDHVERIKSLSPNLFTQPAIEQ
jgi:hypothetical protein